MDGEMDDKTARCKQLLINKLASLYRLQNQSPRDDIAEEIRETEGALWQLLNEDYNATSGFGGWPYRGED